MTTQRKSPAPPTNDSHRDPTSTAPTPWFVPMLRRLHFYAGIFVGPFILIAALTGAIYAFAPQIERALYAEELTVSDSAGEHIRLSEQVAAAQAVAGDRPLVAIRPAPDEDSTTRVIFADASLGNSQVWSVFIDPYTSEVRGEQPVYGSSGSLPFRTQVAQMHRHLFLGDVGRLYSELAASWLLVVVTAGVALWVSRWRNSRPGRRRGLLLPDSSRRGFARTRSWHASAGIWLTVGGLFLAATGITWSVYGGSNVSDLRAAFNWQTPSVQTQPEAADSDEHASHDHHGGGSSRSEAVETDTSAVDTILRTGREAGFTSTHLEMVAPAEPGQAWGIHDVSMNLPAPTIMSVAVDADTMSVSDQLEWDDYPVVAKAAQWGTWMHMGTLFGLANQLLLMATALGIATMVIWGYLMWWQRRPRHRPDRRMGSLPSRGALVRAPWWGKTLTVAALMGVGWFLPVLGVSLVAFVAVDLILGVRARRTSTRSAVG